MIVARQKKKENIAEYLLYMWQIEDIIRACGGNIDVIKSRLSTVIGDSRPRR